MNPQNEIQLLRDASVVQALAIELLQDLLSGHGGDEYSDCWMECIELAHVRYSTMTIAERNAFSRRRKELFTQWLNAKSQNSPSTDQAVA